MTPKEKAEELVEKFRIHQPVWEVEDDAKQCALIAVDEMIDMLERFSNYKSEYWREVKNEIEKL